MTQEREVGKILVMGRCRCHWSFVISQESVVPQSLREKYLSHGSFVMGHWKEPSYAYSYAYSNSPEPRGEGQNSLHPAYAYEYEYAYDGNFWGTSPGGGTEHRAGCRPEERRASPATPATHIPNNSPAPRRAAIRSPRSLLLATAVRPWRALQASAWKRDWDILHSVTESPVSCGCTSGFPERALGNPVHPVHPVKNTKNLGLTLLYDSSHILSQGLQIPGTADPKGSVTLPPEGGTTTVSATTTPLAWPVDNGQPTTVNRQLLSQQSPQQPRH